jgi:hypothetical protein
MLLVGAASKDILCTRAVAFNRPDPVTNRLDLLPLPLLGRCHLLVLASFLRPQFLKGLGKLYFELGNLPLAVVNAREG